MVCQSIISPGRIAIEKNDYQGSKKTVAKRNCKMNRCPAGVKFDVFMQG